MSLYSQKEVALYAKYPRKSVPRSNITIWDAEIVQGGQRDVACASGGLFQMN